MLINRIAVFVYVFGRESHELVHMQNTGKHTLNIILSIQGFLKLGLIHFGKQDEN